MSLQRYSANTLQLVEFVYEDPKMHKATLTEAWFKTRTPGWSVLTSTKVKSQLRPWLLITPYFVQQRMLLIWLTFTFLYCSLNYRGLNFKWNASKNLFDPIHVYKVTSHKCKLTKQSIEMEKVKTCTTLGCKLRLLFHFRIE